MEENIHDDKLDDYVRKSFEGHEEEPPSDLWERVEIDLMPPVEIAPPRTIHRSYGWQAMAAMVILVLFSMLVCEHLYYKEKLREMTGKPVEQQEMISMQKRLDESSDPQVQTNTNSKSTPGTPSQTESNTLKPNLEKNPEQESTSFQRNATSQQQGGKAVDTERDIVIAKSGAPELQDVKYISEKPDLTTFTAGGTINEFPTQQPTTPHTTAIQSFQTPIDIELLPVSSKLLEIPGSSPEVLRKTPIKPLQEPSGWYVGGQISLLTSIEKSRALNPRPGRPVFSSNQKKKDVSANWWLKTGKKLNNRFLLESGIGYQKTSLTATHSPRFRFGDGVHPGGPLATRRTFNYDLSTYGGTAEVSLRMEQTAPGPPASDAEPVILKITTTEQTEMIRIPLLAGYRLGSRRFHGQLKAGLMGNFILKNELDVSARVSQNVRFQPVMDTDGYTLQLNQKKVFLGYWMSAGAEFKWSQHLSLAAEFAILGDFPRKDQHNRRLQERLMLGFNVGANYYF